MKRLVYTPKINAWINTDFGIIDLSEFIVSSTIERRINQVSSATLMLRNPKKEDGKMLFTEHLLDDGSFGPLLHAMDPIIISLTRLKDRSIQVFTGYCDKTPYLQLYAGVVQVDASCTLKRLQYTYWDPGLPFTREFLAQYGWFPDAAHGGIQNPSATVPNPSTPGSTTSNPGVLVPGPGDKTHGHVTLTFAKKTALTQFSKGHSITTSGIESEQPKGKSKKMKVYTFDISGGGEVLVDYFTGEVLQWETGGSIHAGNRNSGGEGESIANRPGVVPTNFQDGSIGMLLMGVLQNVGGWDASTIYIEPLPSGIGTLVANLFKQFQTSVSENHQVQGAFADLLSDLIGQNSLGGGLTTTTTTTPGGSPNVGSNPHNLKGVVQVVAAFAKRFNLPGPFILAVMDAETGITGITSSGNSAHAGWFQMQNKETGGGPPYRFGPGSHRVPTTKQAENLTFALGFFCPAAVGILHGNRSFASKGNWRSWGETTQGAGGQYANWSSNLSRAERLWNQFHP